MNIDFALDFDTEEVDVVVDNAYKVKAAKTEDGVKYYNFDRIDDDEVMDKIKQMCNVILTLC